MTTVPRRAARQPVSRCQRTISRARHSAARSTERRRARVGRRPADDPGDRLRHRGARCCSRGTAVWRGEASHLQGSPVFSVKAEAIGGGHEDEAGTYRQREHLVDVVLTAARRPPGGPAVRRTPHPAHMDVHEDRPTGKNRAFYPLRAWALGRSARPRRFGRCNLQRKGIGLPTLATPVR